MTEAEKAIWRMMRSRQIGGYRFRRQVPLGHYIADFVCHEVGLIVEIDEGQHEPSSPQEAERSRFLAGQGYRILRFWNNDVLANPDGVWTAIAADLSRPHPHPTLPHQGGGLTRVSCQPGAKPRLRTSLEWHDFADLPASQLYELLRFRQAIFVVEQACAYPDLDDVDQRAHHLLLREDAALAGYLRLIPHPSERRIAIGRVAIGIPWRRRGLAGRLMGEALARARHDYPELAVTLSAQTYLTAFYEGLGFCPISAPFDDHGVPHIRMALW